MKDFKEVADKAKETLSENLVIVNTEPRAIYLPPADVQDFDEARGLRLLPGENNVSSLLWEAIQSNPAVKIWVTQELLVNRGAGKAKPLADGLDNLTLAQAATQIAKCESGKFLADLREKTTNAPIIELINKRIREIIEK